jgi:hypothetical protein
MCLSNHSFIMDQSSSCIGRHAKKKFPSSVQSTHFGEVCLHCTVEDIPVRTDDTLLETLCTQTTITHFTLVLQVYSVTNIHSNVRTKIWVIPSNNRGPGPSNRYKDSLWSNYRIRIGTIITTHAQTVPRDTPGSYTMG